MSPNWRVQKKLVMRKKPDGTGLIFSLKNIILTSCQLFTLAPWTDRTALYWQVELCTSGVTTPVSAVKDDSPTFRGSPVVYTNGGGKGRIRIKEAAAISQDDLFHMLTGVSGSTNNWLLLMEQAANRTPSDCVACMSARPTPNVVPAYVNSTCLLHLTNGTKSDSCAFLDKIFTETPKAISNKPPFFSKRVAPGNFTCVNLTGTNSNLGQINSSWCADIVHSHGVFSPTPRADLWWWCGQNTLRDGFPPNSFGLCALVTLILPVSLIPVDSSPVENHYLSRLKRPKRSIFTKHTIVPGVYDPTYIDAIGVPRGVPDEYKLVDQVAAGFENIPIISAIFPVTPNKNVDRINYIHFNVQLLANFTRDGLEAVHAQLSATSLMAFQNRIAVDMLLAEKGGVCGMFGDQCCTFIPNNTAADGSLTKAIAGLRTLTDKMKDHSGVDTTMWDSMFDVFGKYKTLVWSILLSIAVFTAILTTCSCCCIPCIRALIQRLITTAITPEPNDVALQMPLLRTQHLDQGDSLSLPDSIVVDSDDGDCDP
uniref:Envelope protein n=1 Tax=Nothobranchius furzeri TaxID=105023 RepID=A0A8C6NTS2_NOTFU